MDETAQKIIAIIADKAMLDTNDITLDTSIEELGVDSLSLVESIFDIEEAFDITVPFNANEPTSSNFDISTVGSIVVAVESLIAKKEQA